MELLLCLAPNPSFESWREPSSNRSNTGGEEGILVIACSPLWAHRFESLLSGVGFQKVGGEEGIRTPDTVSGIPDFESGAFSHSATSPEGVTS